jgi:hypothetical protein
LVFFEHFEVFFLKSEHLNVRALVGIEDELDVLPGLVELSKGLFHLGFLLGLVRDFFDILLIFVQVEVVHITEHKLGVNSEVDLNLGPNGVPMAFTHGRVTELRDEGNELQPALDLFEDASVSVAALVNFHLLEGLLELLGHVIHVITVGVVPRGLQVALKVGLAGSDVLPERSHVVDLELDGINLLDGVVNEVGVAKLG